MDDRLGKRQVLRRGLTWTVVVTAAIFLAGCDKQPEGQVVAVVNGDEITLQELNAELGNVELPEGAAKDEIRNQALDNMGLSSTQTLATLFDGITRHTAEGRWFKDFAGEHGFGPAVAWRDSGRPIPDGGGPIPSADDL